MPKWLQAFRASSLPVALCMVVLVGVLAFWATHRNLSQAGGVVLGAAIAGVTSLGTSLVTTRTVNRQIVAQAGERRLDRDQESQLARDRRREAREEAWRERRYDAYQALLEVSSSLARGIAQGFLDAARLPKMGSDLPREPESFLPGSDEERLNRVVETVLLIGNHEVGTTAEEIRHCLLRWSEAPYMAAHKGHDDAWWLAQNEERAAKVADLRRQFRQAARLDVGTSSGDWPNASPMPYAQQ